MPFPLLSAKKERLRQDIAFQREDSPLGPIPMSFARKATVGGVRAGLRGERVVRRRRAQEHVPEIVRRLNKEINDALADPETMARLADQGGTGLPGSPTDFGKLVAEETEKWGKVVQFSGAKPD